MPTALSAIPAKAGIHAAAREWGGQTFVHQKQQFGEARRQKLVQTFLQIIRLKPGASPQAAPARVTQVGSTVVGRPCAGDGLWNGGSWGHRRGSPRRGCRLSLARMKRRIQPTYASSVRRANPSRRSLPRTSSSRRGRGDASAGSGLAPPFFSCDHPPIAQPPVRQETLQD